MTVLAHLEPQRQLRDARKDARKRLKLLTSATTLRAGAANVLVLDLSTTGMLIQSDDALAAGDRIEVQLPGTGARRADVVWAGGGYFGCSFATPVSPAAVSAALLRSAPATPPQPALKPRPPRQETVFADRLVALRTERGWSIERLAERLAVSRQAVWYWETGRRRPRPALLRRIAEAFEVTELDLLGGAERARPPGNASIVEQLRREIAIRLGCDPTEIKISIEI